jgi:outer membrane receptor for ferrienterochelin and colicin
MVNRIGNRIDRCSSWKNLNIAVALCQPRHRAAAVVPRDPVSSQRNVAFVKCRAPIASPDVMQKSNLAIAVAAALLGTLAAARAEAQDPATGNDAPRSLATVVVQEEITYRNRTDATPPVLSYDLEFFQRFEPLTVGDMLKRVPGVAFVSDVLEFDGVRLRGLDPGYTQILINGKKVPGQGDDRSFFVDRIPAELVERIEIVRSPSANRSGDAVAGAINIVLRDAYEFEGAYVRAGALYFDSEDGEWKGTGGGVLAGEVGGGRVLLGVNAQGRYNPKTKRSERFEEPGGDFVDREDQSDVRDGEDYSANASYTRDIGAGTLNLSGFLVQTDRTETENSLEYNDPVSTSPDNLLSINDQVEDIDQTNWSLAAGFEFPALGGNNELGIDYAAFEEDTTNTEEQVGFDDDDTPPSFDEFEGTRELFDLEDDELRLAFAHQRALGAMELELGLQYQDKDRDTVLDVSEVSTDEEGAPLPPYAEFERSSSTIEERRIDPYVMLSGASDALAWEAGLRYETTDTDIAADGDDYESDLDTLLPSAHLRWDLSDDDRLRGSLGRTVRRPDFNFLNPITLEGEYGDNDFVGNPGLEAELAWGIDFGYERRLGAQGVFGVNVFWRDVDDLIELVNTGEPSETAIGDFEDEVDEFLDENPGAGPGTPGFPEFDPDSFVYSADNVGDGTVYGIEFDLSTPLTAIGLPNTGVFANYAWLDSEVDDAIGERTFNDQPDYVYNVGFIHDLPQWGMTFGASYRRQGDAYSRLLAEEVETSYDGDLEAFIEKRFGERFAVRLTGSNLLDASKDEVFRKFDTLADQLDRDYDEFELETESSVRFYQIIARYSF